MNKTEQRFSKYLDLLVAAGEINGWMFEPLKFRLTETDWRTTLTPDFAVARLDDTLEMIDCKGSGGWEEDARIKMRMAASKFYWFHWAGYVEGPRNTWTREEFTAGVRRTPRTSHSHANRHQL